MAKKNIFFASPISSAFLALLAWAAILAVLPSTSFAQTLMPPPNTSGSVNAETGRPSPGATEWACKILAYGGTGNTKSDIGFGPAPSPSSTPSPDGSTTCGIGPPPAGSVPCYIPSDNGGNYAVGWCLIPAGVVPTTTTIPQQPPPAAPLVTGASCPAAPPATWFDPDAPAGSTAASWTQPAEPNMNVSEVPINGLAPSWTVPARNAASALFTTLFVFEVFMLGIQALLYHHNLAHLFSSYAFKTFAVTFFIYLTANAPTIFPPIINSFKIAGQTTGVAATPNLMDIYQRTDAAAALFFCAAAASHIDDNETALEYGYFGQMRSTDDAGQMLTGAVGHITFEFIVQALGMLVIAAAGIMFLSLALVTTEAYIVMFAGVFFTAFSTMRFTAPFTQGYLGYTINVGAKLFTYWVVVAIESNVLLPYLITAGTQLIPAASIQFGAQSGGNGQEYYLVSASAQVAEILAAAALTWIIPNLAGRYVSTRGTAAAVEAVSALTWSIKTVSLGGAGARSFNSAPPPPEIIAGPAGMSPSFVNTTPARSPGEPSNPFATPQQTIVSPFSPAPGGAGAVAARANSGVGISGYYTQAVQASVSDGPDPFAAPLKAPQPTIIFKQKIPAPHSLAGTPAINANDDPPV